MAEQTRDAATAGTLDAATVESLRQQLLRERSDLLVQIDRLEADFRDESWKEPRSDDDAETGTATYERERTISLAQNARAMVRRIDRALTRIDAGGYGICSSCGKPIAPARLQAIPHAVLCLDCQRAAERR